MPKAWKPIFSEWIPSNEYDVAEMPAIEAYIDPDPHHADSSNQIWLAVILNYKLEENDKVKNIY
ncbi:hypothetical protein [Ammoniphilus sp. YIM 78166]|uniref:hypothetical protein n=1 Tax=Ammoniphilus sp. YIM 78166 TaxID=1644106 RepID=UPI0014308DDB|nr:hypothetical protein [Ammoniphilus sp. YIM 78166]